MDRITEAELQEIRDDHAAAMGGPDWDAAQYVPRLVAEVHRLRALIVMAADDDGRFKYHHDVAVEARAIRKEQRD